MSRTYWTWLLSTIGIIFTGLIGSYLYVLWDVSTHFHPTFGYLLEM